MFGVEGRVISYDGGRGIFSLRSLFFFSTTCSPIHSFSPQTPLSLLYLRHYIKSLPVSLNSGTSNDSIDKSKQNTGEGKKKKNKGKGEEVQSLNVNWACSESLGDDVRYVKQQSVYIYYVCSL